MEQIKVILVDDDTDLGNLISLSLSSDGYKVHYQNSLAGIEAIIQEFEPSILVLDVEVGEDDGIEKAKEIILTHPSLPILFISSHTDIESINRGISTGGVHYLRKPFEIQELEIYINRFALSENHKEIIAAIGSYSLNFDSRELFYKHTYIKQLSPLEYSVLILLFQNRNEVIANDTLSEKVWSKKFPDTEASINNVISKLRKLLKNDPNVCIQTIKNRGYKLIF